MKKRWLITPRTQDNLIDQLLTNRGVVDRDRFIEPRYEALHDPWQLLNMTVLVDRIIKAIDTQEKIAIFGDYDHDGTPAAALLSDGIRLAGGLVKTVYIPAREEGYSISPKVIDQFNKEGIDLLILVDCGITNKAELDYAKSKGIDSIVIDHHIVQEDKYPAAAIVVNPKQKGDTYPFKELCACGLAFKVIQALGEKTERISQNKLKWLLDLVAISTICDMVPLVDENRILVHFGLMVLSKTRRPGLKKLLEVAAVDTGSISTYTVGFVIGPRLNAPGRIERASIAYDLLVERDEHKAMVLAHRLNELNTRRQEELDTVLKQAEAAVLEQELHKKKVIVVAGDGWADGVVGLVAGRITEKYSRPSIVLSNRTDGLAKGSARSVDGFHLIDALNECQQYLVKYGGHEKAAGVTLAKDQLMLLYDKIIEIADQKLADDDLLPKVKVDSILYSDEVNLDKVKQLAKLEPYGLANPKPIFILENLSLESVKIIGKTAKHLKLMLRLSNDTVVDSVAFSLANRIDELTKHNHYDVVGFLESNEWQGNTTVQLKVLDWRLTEQHNA